MLRDVPEIGVAPAIDCVPTVLPDVQEGTGNGPEAGRSDAVVGFYSVREGRRSWDSRERESGKSKGFLIYTDTTLGRPWSAVIEEVVLRDITHHRRELSARLRMKLFQATSASHTPKPPPGPPPRAVSVVSGRVSSSPTYRSLESSAKSCGVSGDGFGEGTSMVTVLSSDNVLKEDALMAPEEVT